MQPLGVCLVCGDESRLRCSGCRVAVYCGRIHQKAHWGTHSLTCKPYQIQWDDDIGHHLVASRDLEPGSFILREDVLVYGMAPCFRSSPTCLGGGKCDDAAPEGVKCPNCPWPTMCGVEECWIEGSPHAVGECSLLKKAGTKLSIDQLKKLKPVVLQLTISVLRCLALKERDPLKWEKLMKLDFNFGAIAYRKQNCKFDFQEAVIRLVNEWMKGATLPIPRDMILKLCDVFHILNLFPIAHTSDEGPYGVYSVASRIAHSCVANVTASFKEDREITVRASVPILKGTKLVYNYVCTPWWDTTERQFYLMQDMVGLTFGVGCSCERCKDGTELGTFIGGLYCPKCPDRKGFLVPVDPKEECYILVCTNCKKKTHEYLWSHVKPMLHDEIPLKERTILDCEEFLRRYDSILGPNNADMLETKLDLLEKYFYEEDNAPGSHNDEILRRRVELGVELLKLADIVSPGLNRWRGKLMFHLVTVVHIMSEKQLRVLASMPAGILPPKNEVVLRKMTEEALTILSWEPEGSEEAKWAMKLRGMLLAER